VVTSTSDLGPGTLRECLRNAHYGDTVTFDTSVFLPNKPASISLQTALPALSSGGITIDASDAGVKLDGSYTPAGSDGIHINSEDNIVRGLQVVGFPMEGIAIWASRNTIGGDRKIGRGPLGQGNLVSGNGHGGIRIDGTPTDCVIAGNFIGTTLDGGSAWPNNGAGLTLDNSTNTLVKDNLISGNTSTGISMTDWNAGFNSFVGNLIGTDASGMVALGNGSGVSLAYLGFNRVGGTDPSERNVISGNAGTGMWVGKGIGNLVLGNNIGVDARGTALLANRDGGILIGDTARETVIGGTTDSERNVIGINGGSAVDVMTDFNFIAGNTIGTDTTGSAALGGFRGISLNHASHTIIQKNLVANNAGGVEIKGGSSNTIRQNLIYDNQGGGIVLSDGANAGVSPPVITKLSVTSVSGTACPGCEVEIFSDSDSKVQFFEGSAIADAYGVFRFEKGSFLIGSKITATATDSQGNSSGFSAPQTFSNSLPGDIDKDGDITLADTILALKILVGVKTAGETLISSADVNGDGRIGLKEGIYILQKAAGMR